MISNFIWNNYLTKIIPKVYNLYKLGFPCRVPKKKLILAKNQKKCVNVYNICQ